ncbi:MAG: DUF222 domain-containing protein [Solirubrobacterales bacterium]
MARWLALLAEYDRRDGWWSWHGVRSVAEWIAWRCSISPRAAREHVRVARALRELPRIALRLLARRALLLEGPSPEPRRHRGHQGRPGRARQARHRRAARADSSRLRAGDA